MSAADVEISEIAAAASCGATTITSQSDADLVNACPTVTGDVILATNAAGIINLDGVQVIEGNFGSEGCSGTCASITSLSCAALVSVSQNLTLHNLPSLTNISLSQLQTVGAQFYLESLPSLQELSIPSLASVGLFHLVSAPKLLSMNLTGLQNVTGSDPSIEVVGVGLSYLANLNVNTNLSSFILRDSPNIQDVSLSTPQIDYLEVAGNGSGGFGTSVGNNFISRIGTLNVSGCSGLELSSPTTFDIMILSQNTFSSIFLDPVKVINNLSIVSNFNLNQALLPTDMSIQNIEISGNEVLESQHIVAGTEAWPWGIKNISSMILDGLFENIFLCVPHLIWIQF